MTPGNGTGGYAYYCAKCKNEQTDPETARRFAATMQLSLWMPKDFVEYDFPEGAFECRRAIDGADCVICQPAIGNDCSWELGYAVGSGKTVYILGDLDGDDWMTKIGVHRVDPRTFEIEPTIRPPAKRTPLRSPGLPRSLKPLESLELGHHR